MDLLACSREDPPRCAELVDALACRLARLPIGDEVVERVAVVRDLELAVLPLRRAEERRADTVSGYRLPLRRQRRPEGGARAVARTRRAFVLDEVVQRDSLAVDENASERRRGKGDFRSACLRRAGESKRCRDRRDHWDAASAVSSLIG